MSYPPMNYSGCHGDEGWPSPAEQAATDEECKKIADEMVTDPAWWEVAFGENEVDWAVASCLARCMANLDRACKGELTSLNAITTALSNLQREAKLKAFEEARDA